MDEICAFLDPEHFHLHQDESSDKLLRRLAMQVTAKLPHRAFTVKSTGKKTTFVFGMPRVRKVKKKKRHMELRRVKSAAANVGAASSMFLKGLGGKRNSFSSFGGGSGDRGNPAADV